MNILGPDEALQDTRTVVAMGVFDGVHRGHRRVLARLREFGLQHGLATAVLTFDPHPRRVLQPERAPKMLCSLADRLSLLTETGLADHCLVLPFDRQRSQESVEDFVHRTLVERLRIRALVVGENFACGHKRRGTVDYLRVLGGLHGFDVHAVDLRAPSEPRHLPHCSSSETRRLLQRGEVWRAGWMLGRPHELAGRAAPQGQQRHCAEVALSSEMCAPAAGTYRGAVRYLGHLSTNEWAPTLLEVQPDDACEEARVRILSRRCEDAAAGEPVRLRFLSENCTSHALS